MWEISAEVTAAILTVLCLSVGHLVRARWRTRRIAAALSTEIAIKLGALVVSFDPKAVKRAADLIREGRQPVFIIETGVDPIFDGHQSELSSLPRSLVRRITAYYRVDRYLNEALDFANSPRFMSEDFDVDRRLRYLELVYPELVQQTSRAGFSAYLALTIWLELNVLERMNLAKRCSAWPKLYRAKLKRAVGLGRKRFPWALYLGPKPWIGP